MEGISLSYGWEIEFVDQRRSILKPLLPPGCKFSRKEVTLINSNGLAVDSGLGAAHDWGGEINTPPVYSLPDAIHMGREVFGVLLMNGATSNYRCNTQFHIGIVEYKTWSDQDQLIFLKRAQKFFYENAKSILDLTMGETNFKKESDYPSSFWLHHQELPLSERKHEALMNAKTVKEFQNGFFLTEKGNYHFANFQRQYVNTHQMFKTGTIEFRNFYNAKNSSHFDNIVMFCNLLFHAMLNVIQPKQFQEMLGMYSRDHFPFRDPFDLVLENKFQATRVKKSTPKN